MSALIAAILAIAKAVPAAEQFLAMLMEAYRVQKLNANLKDEQNKNARDDAAIDDAIGRMPRCPACGAPIVSGGQHGAAGQTPAVPGSGGSGS